MHGGTWTTFFANRSKYEAARLGGVEGGPLQVIEEQLRNEVGEDWRTDDAVVAG